jgi:peptide/nickel transport system permease protein
MPSSIPASLAPERPAALRALVALAGNPVLAGALLIIVLLVAAALLAPYLAPYDPFQMRVGPRLTAPGGDHLFGTDELGRDLFSRILYGARLTLWVGTVAVGIGLGVGVLVGLVAGYSVGWVRGILMRAVDVLYAFPDTLIALALLAFLGPSLTNAMIAIGVSVVPYYARVTYGVVIVERVKPYVDACATIGAGPLRILFRHILPNCLPPLVVVASLGFSSAVLSAAGLSFLGLGAQPPAPEWGAILANGRNYILRAPWILIFPGVAIALTVLAFNVAGDGLRRYLDPRQKRVL